MHTAHCTVHRAPIEFKNIVSCILLASIVRLNKNAYVRLHNKNMLHFVYLTHSSTFHIKRFVREGRGMFNSMLHIISNGCHFYV